MKIAFVVYLLLVFGIFLIGAVDDNVEVLPARRRFT